MHVANLYPLGDDAIRRLQAVAPNIEIDNFAGIEDQAIDDLDLPDVEVIFGDRPPQQPERAPRLRWLATAGAGIEYLDAGDLLARDVIVTNGSGLHAVAMGEYCLGAILFAAQHQAERVELQRGHRWERSSAVGERLRGRTVCVVGYGSIGREVARLLRSFGTRVIAVKARPDIVTDEGYREDGTGDPAGSIPDRIVGIDGLIEAVADADFVVLSLPLTDGTRGLIDRQVLDSMRRSAWIVNVGRGQVIATSALVEALGTRTIGGAYLDVFDDEPLPSDHPLWDIPSAHLTPHVAGTNDPAWSWAAMGGLCERNLRHWVRAEALINRVDLTRGY